jgi:cytochrome c2
MNHNPLRIVKISILFLFFSLFSFAQDEIKGDAVKGKELFNKNCTACHKMGAQLVGPDLTGVVLRLKKDQNIGREWFQKWIKDNKALRASGDKYANEVFEKFKKSEMQQFPNLSDQDVDDILTYAEDPTKVPDEKPKEETKSQNASSSNQNSNSSGNIVLISFLIIAGLLAWIAFKLYTLVKLTVVQEGVSELQENQITSFNDFYAKNRKFAYVLFSLVSLFALYALWAMLFGLGVDKGYKPEQPIYFSHKIHAGINGIDCQLCHSSAKYGKVSGIPTLNTCMNCHRNISEYKGEYIEEGMTRDDYTKEIKKIYEHVGWDEATQSYSKPQKPIKWTRIHNMPDFVAFNHATHVVGGEKAIIEAFNKKNPENQIDVVCKACHGKIDTMNVVQMANDFTMGWCIDCHRTTKIDMSNGYNAAYFSKLHEKVKKQKGKNAELTVDAIGGLECGKCHY